MTQKILLSTILFFSIATVQAAPAVPTRIVVGGSPCTGGPTDCRLLITSGKILIEGSSGRQRTLRVSATGMTFVRLTAGRYKFRFKVTSPLGSSETVEQDIKPLSRGYNLVTIETDTGIR